MNRILVISGLACLTAAIGGGEPEAFGASQNIFLIPTANIRIDGKVDDWERIRPVLRDPRGDEDPNADFPGTDLQEFYLAKDDRYLYLAMTLYDGLPQPRLETAYFFVASRRPSEVDVPGDMDAAVSYFGEEWKVWTAKRGSGGRPQGALRYYSSDFVASGPGFVEWKVPLNDVGQLDGRFVRVYIHVVGPRPQNVSDQGLSGIELRLTPRERVLTPSLLGQTVPEAKQAHPNLNLQLVEEGRRYSSEPAETIIAQKPNPRESLPDDRRVSVWLSQGPEPPLLTPDLRGQKVQEAREKYVDPRLQLVERGQHYSAEPAGTIMDQKPNPGEPLPDDRRIDVWLSAGPEPPLLTPDLRGQKVPEAERRYVDLRLQLTERGEQYSPEPAGTIMDQKPNPGEPLPDDRRIDVWLSQGPEPQLLTPDFRGQTVPDAERRYVELRLQLTERGEQYSPEPAGTIIAQDPNPDEPLPRDRRIGVWLSQGPAPPPLTPNLRGQTIPEAQQMHVELNLQLIELGRRHSFEATGTIIAQAPNPGEPLPDDRRVGVWLSRSLWPPILIGLTMVAVIVGLLPVVLSRLRPGERGEHKRRSEMNRRSPVQFTPHTDPGHQTVEAETGAWTAPSISTRFQVDHGVQETEVSPTREEE